MSTIPDQPDNPNGPSPVPGNGHPAGQAAPDPMALMLEEIRELRLLVRDLAGAKKPGPTVGQVVEAYLEEAWRGMATRTFFYRKNCLEDLKEALGEKLVSEVVPFDLLNWINSHPGWKAADTRRSAIHGVKRCFNWARQMRMIPASPFADFPAPGGERRRALTDDEYTSFLRASTACFRRVLVFLWLTGCRTCEATGLLWSNVHLDVDPQRGIYKGWIILHKHKTVRKTKKPRKIPLVPAVVKLLLWIRRDQDRPPLDEWLVQTLEKEGPRLAVEIIARAREQFHCCAKKVYNARQKARLHVFRQGGPQSRCFWCLPSQGPAAACPVGGRPRQRPDPPESPIPPPEPRADQSEFVFLNGRGTPWNQGGLSNRLQKLRAKLGMAPGGATLYGTRHAFGTNSIVRGVDVLTLSKLMGHETVAMTEHYVNLAEHPEYLEGAMLQATGMGPRRESPAPKPGP